MHFGDTHTNRWTASMCKTALLSWVVA